MKIKNLRRKKPKHWHRELKKLTRFDQHQDDVIVVENIKDLSDIEQAELIADKFAEVSQEYKNLKLMRLKFHPSQNLIILKFLKKISGRS